MSNTYGMKTLIGNFVEDRAILENNENINQHLPESTTTTYSSDFIAKDFSGRGSLVDRKLDIDHDLMFGHSGNMTQIKNLSKVEFIPCTEYSYNVNNCARNYTNSVLKYNAQYKRKCDKSKYSKYHTTMNDQFTWKTNPDAIHGSTLSTIDDESFSSLCNSTHLTIGLRDKATPF